MSRHLHSILKTNSPQPLNTENSQEFKAFPFGNHRPKTKEEHSQYITGIEHTIHSIQPKKPQLGNQSVQNIRALLSPLPIPANSSKAAPNDFNTSNNTSFRMAQHHMLSTASSHFDETFLKKPPKKGYWLNQRAVPLKKRKIYNDFEDDFWKMRKMQNFLSLEEEITQVPSLSKDDFANSAQVEVQNLENWYLEKKLVNGMNKRDSKEQQDIAKPTIQSELSLINDSDEPKLSTDLINLIFDQSQTKKPPPAKLKKPEKILSSVNTVKYIRSYKKYMHEVSAPTASNESRIGAKQSCKAPETIRTDLNRFILNEMVGEKLRKEFKENPEKLKKDKVDLSDAEICIAEKLAVINPAKKIARRTIGNFTAFKEMYMAGDVRDELSVDYLIKMLRHSKKKEVKNTLNFSQEYKEYISKNGTEAGTNMSLQGFEAHLISKYKEAVEEHKSNKAVLLERVGYDINKNAMIKRQTKAVTTQPIH